MLIALLIVLGVDLIVVAAFVVGSRRRLKRLGDEPVVIEFASGGAKIEVGGGLSVTPWWPGP